MAAGDPVYGAHIDNVNQQYSMLGVIGTLGTADAGGTAYTLPIGVNPDTGAMYVDVIDTTFNVGTLTVGTINKVGTVSEVTTGTVRIPAGTITTIDSLSPYVYDNIVVTYPSGSVEAYAYFLGATGKGTLTVTYTDATKGSVSTVVKTP